MQTTGQAAQKITDTYAAAWSRGLNTPADLNQVLANARESADVKSGRESIHKDLTDIEISLRAIHQQRTPEDAFAAAARAYELLARLAAYVDLPTGTLQTFNQTTGELSNELSGAIARARAYLPENSK
jgi:hypothetical protein